MFDERDREIQRIQHTAEMLTNMPQSLREEIKGVLDVRLDDLEANLRGYIAERMELHRAFVVELLVRPYHYSKKEDGLYLLESEIVGTAYDVAEMLNIISTVHTVLEQRDES